MRTLTCCCLAVLAGAVDLPPSALLADPQGILVEHRGTMPAGDTVVTGLLPELHSGSLTVQVEGLDRPQWSLSPVTPAEQTAQTPAQLKAEDDLALATAALARAKHRRDLAEAALGSTGSATAALPSAEDQQAQAAFGQRQLEAALTEEAAALTALAAARAALHAEPTATPIMPWRLTIAGADGRAVVVSYRVSKVGARLTYRLEIDGATQRLLHLVDLDWAGATATSPLPLTISSRSKDGAVLVPAPVIRELGVSEGVAEFATPRRPTLSAVECAVGMKWLTLRLRADGSVGSTGWDVRATALATLAMAGAGSDHRTPNRYRATVQRMLTWLRGRDPEGLPLVDLALTTMAVAELHAMTGDKDLLQPVTSLEGALLRRVSNGPDLEAAMLRFGPLAGPEVLAYVAMAAKSLKADQRPSAPAMLAICRRHLSLLDRMQADDESRAASLVVRLNLGDELTDVTTAEAQVWVRRLPRWWQRGQLECMYLTTLAASQRGGDVWRIWNATYRDFVIGKQRDGAWKTSYTGDATAADALLELSMEIYRRYSPVRLAGDTTTEATDTVALATEWPLRWTLPQPVTLHPGRNRLTMAVIPLSGRHQWEAHPIQDASVWRQLEATNPLPTPLPAAPVTVVMGGVPVGQTELPFTVPGASFILPLGADPRLSVTRTATVTSDDGLTGRVLTVALQFAVQAPVDFTGTIRVSEPMPRTDHEDLTWKGLEPSLSADALAKLRAKDPAWHWDLPRDGSAAIRWQVSYPKRLRPFLEVLP